MLYREKNIPELHDLKHRNDNQENEPIDIENNILKKSLSPHIYNNNNMNNFLNKLEKLSYLLVDQMYIMKNFKNYMVDKYYNKHID